MDTWTAYTQGAPGGEKYPSPWGVGAFGGSRDTRGPGGFATFGSNPYGSQEPFANAFESSAGWENPIDRFTQQSYEQMAKMFPGMSGTPGGGGAVSPDIGSAAARAGVPAAVLQAMVIRESSGDWASNSGQRCDIRTNADGSPNCMVPYTGIFASTAASWGIDFTTLPGNQQAQLDAMAKILTGIKQQQGYTDWGDVAAYYFAGPNVNVPGWVDENGMDVVTYRNSFNADVARYGGSATYAGGGAGGLEAIWGGGTYPITQEIGPTDFSATVDWYQYGLDYGLDGRSHTGIDVGMPAGTRLYAPMGGTVVCAGTGNGTEGCAAFASAAGGAGSGRFEIALDNGWRLIYGHVNGSLVAPGTRVQAGQAVALSGSENGDHLHLELRIPDASTPSGWRIVDPRLYLGNAYTAPYAVPGTGYGQQGGGYWFQQPLSVLLGGGR